MLLEGPVDVFHEGLNAARVAQLRQRQYPEVSGLLG